MGMRLLPTDWTAKCESVENQYRVWVLDYEQALHSTSCLPVHPSIRRKRGESNGCSFLLDGGLRVLEKGEGGSQWLWETVSFTTSRWCCVTAPSSPPPSSPPPSTTALPLPSPSVTYLTTTVCDSFAFCQDCINPLPTERFYKNTDLE